MKRFIKFVVIETLYGIAIAILDIIHNIVNIMASQVATEAEMLRLKGEMPLAFTDTLSRYNNSFNVIYWMLLIILVAIMFNKAYEFFKNELDRF